jgi:general secretion pathway protein B
VLPVIGALAAAVLVLGAAWWHSTRAGNDVAPAAATTRTVELPPPTPQPVAAAASPAAPPRAPLAEATRTSTPTTSPSTHTSLEAVAGAETAAVAREDDPPAAANLPILPSAAALASEGVPLPDLRLDLHAYSEQRGNRFVFINGRKYGEGERLPDNLVLEAIEPRGAVLSYNGRRFLLVPE